MTLAAFKARDLTPAVREWLQSLLQRPLNEGDDVSVMIRSPAQPTLNDREEARRRLFEHLAKFQENIKCDEAEMEEAIEEALRAVRPSYRPITQ